MAVAAAAARAEGVRPAASCGRPTGERGAGFARGWGVGCGGRGGRVGPVLCGVSGGGRTLQKPERDAFVDTARGTAGLAAGGGGVEWHRVRVDATASASSPPRPTTTK